VSSPTRGSDVCAEISIDIHLFDQSDATPGLTEQLGDQSEDASFETTPAEEPTKENSA